MTSNLKIAVLITCHNRKTKTITCLDSLFASVLPRGYTLDVFLVDDGCTDGTAEAIFIKYPQIKIIQGNGNLYWNRGMHLAWQTAAQESDYGYYLWLNDDTNLFENALKVLLVAANSTNNSAIIAAATCSKHTGALTYSGFQLQGAKISPKNDLFSIATFNGNCVLIPDSIYQQVGNLDPLFQHALGDIDYGYRAIKKGIKSFLAPGFLAYCEGHYALPKWCLGSVPLKERVLSLYSPLGSCHPYEYFYFDLRHFGLLSAIKHFITINLRMLAPSLWKKLKKEFS